MTDICLAPIDGVDGERMDGGRSVGRPIDNHKSTGWHTVDTQLKALQPALFGLFGLHLA